MEKRILFITSTRVGDAVLSTGVLGKLLDGHPRARVTVVCGPAAADLFRPVPGLERLIVLEKKRRSLHWLDFWRQCAGTFWNVVVDLRNAPLSYLLAVRRQYHLGKVEDTEHRVERLARVLGSSEPLPPRLWTSAEDEARAAEEIGDGRFVLAIGPTANWRAKTWRQEHFAALVRALTAPDGLFPDARVAVFGHASERDQVSDFISAIPDDRRIDLLGKLTLSEVAACLKRCRFYVGNDSGLMHMAAASGLPTLGLFGPSRDDLYGPWGAGCEAIRGLGFEESFPEAFDYRTSDSLMDALTVEMVVDRIDDMWSRLGVEPVRAAQ